MALTKKYDKAQTPCRRLLNSEHTSAATKAKLKQEYEHLDPVKLLNRLSHYQAIFWQYAWSKPINQAKQPQTDSINTLSQQADETEVKKEAGVSGDITLLNRQYRRTKKPRKTMQPRTWRTRKDPFAQEWDALRVQLELNPHTTAKRLLDQLLIEQPDKFSHKLLRTLQRRVARWRKQQCDEAKQQHQLQSAQEETTRHYLSLVMESATSSEPELSANSNR